MNLTQRPATHADVEFARRAHHDGYFETAVRQFGHWDEVEQDRLFEQTWSALPHQILLCDGERCGYMATEDAPDHVFVFELVMHADFRGRGIGTVFLQRVVDTACERGVPVRLRVLLGNTAIDFYKKLGFHEYGRTQLHVLMQFQP